MSAPSNQQEHTPTDPSVAIWDEKHFKSLLGLPRFPLQLIQEEPWESWIEQRGGIDAVRSFLTACSLPPKQQELLQIILDCPSTHTQYYADRLNVSASTYFRLIIDLANNLVARLNSWAPGQLVADATTNLPVPLTALIGADDLLVAASETLIQPEVRLMTITGPGGVGKTRFAIQLAANLSEHFRDGVYFIPLAAANDAALLMTEIVRVLGIRENNNRSLPAILKAYLRNRNLLLLLDSFEHLIGTASMVTDLLWQASNIKIIVTSREALHLSGEHHFEIPLMALPDLDHLPPLEQLEQYPSVQLFVERARSIQPDFRLTDKNAATVAEVCSCLDGLPLAIELAAARIKLFSPMQMLPQMHNRLNFLKNGLRDKETRHQTLWDTIDWSHALLDEQEKALFRKLAVFAGDWSLEAAKSVCGTTDAETDIETLLHKSLVQVIGIDGSGRSRFQLLQTIQEYASQQLDAGGETHETKKRHAYYYLALLEEAEQPSQAPLERKSAHIKQEHNNIRAALSWLIQEEPETALRLMVAILPFRGVLDIMSAGQGWVEQVLEQTQHLKTSARVEVLQGAGWSALSQNDYARGETYFGEALALAQRLEEKYLIASSLHGVGELLLNQQDYEQARTLFEESLTLFHELGDKLQIAWTLDHLANLAHHLADATQAQLLMEEALEIFQEVGFPWGKSIVLVHLGRILLDLGKYKQAQESLENALALRKEHGMHWPKDWVYDILGSVMLAQGNHEDATSLLKESLSLYSEDKNEWGIITILAHFAVLSIAQADYVEAVQLSSLVSAKLRAFELSMPANVAQLTESLETKILSAARSQLEETIYEQAWGDGGALSLNSVVVALKESMKLPVAHARLNTGSHDYTWNRENVMNPDSIIQTEVVEMQR